MNALTTAPIEDSSQVAAGREFLTFRLGDEEYGIDILKVQEIRGYDTVTKIANTPDFIKGVINLRGAIVPIVDMRVKLNIGDAVCDKETVVIMLNIARRVVGMVVDSVSDVSVLSPEQLRPPPELGTVVNTAYLMGLGVIDERMLILIDIERLMTSTDMALMSEI